MTQSHSARVGLKNPSKSLANPGVQPPPEPPESSEAEIEESPVEFNTPWPGPDFKVGNFLPGSVYLWACGEPFQGGNMSRVSSCQAASAWIILMVRIKHTLRIYCLRFSVVLKGGLFARGWNTADTPTFLVRGRKRRHVHCLLPYNVPCTCWLACPAHVRRQAILSSYFLVRKYTWRRTVVERTL